MHDTARTRDADRETGLMLEDSPRFEHAALDSLANGVVINDIVGQVVLLNQAAARILHMDSKTATGRPVRTLFEPLVTRRGRLSIMDAIERLCANPHAYGRDGEPAETVIESGTRFIQAHLSPMLSDKGDFLGVVTLLRDVTREVEAHRVTSDFVSNVSHELRLPLTAIKGYCDLLSRDALDQLNEEHRRFLQIIQSNADHLVALINDSLEISRIESYRLDLDIQPVQMETVIRDIAADLVRPQCDLKGLRLTVEIEPNLGTVLGDPSRLKQVIASLANTACRYTPEGGQITLSLSRTDLGIQVDVSDTGIGIFQKDQASMFRRFYRPESSLTHELYGTGLELPIAKMLVEMHGGRLWVESTPGQGSTFTLILPQHVVAVGADPRETAAQSEETRTVLVVEDDADIAQLIALQLRREGFEVLTAMYGEEAVSLAHSHAVDLITLDMMLPDITGTEVLRRIKADPETADTPVIILSVLLPEQIEDGGHGVVDYITKPFAFEKLMESIRHTLKTSGRKPPAGRG
jgi:PAS domain S-box-containing protein